MRNALVELTDIAPTLLELAGVDIPERMQGRSLKPLLSDANAADHHRDFVRCEYYQALNPSARESFTGSYGTMIRDDRHKLVVYHGHELGELYDLRDDPGEFNNLWDDPAAIETKVRLMQQNFDALAFAVDTGPKLVTRF